MTLDELIQRVPEQFRPVAARYGPALLQMSAAELWGWVHLLIEGRTDAAYRAVLDRMDNADLITEWDKVNDQWKEANIQNAASKDVQRRAVLAVLNVLLTMALALVGF